MKATNLVTIEDYIYECGKVNAEMLRAKNRRDKRSKRRYLCRLVQEIQTFDKYKGTAYAKVVEHYLRKRGQEI